MVLRSRRLNEDYNAKITDTDKNEAVFQAFETDSGMPSNTYHSKMSNLKLQETEDMNPRAFSKFQNSKYIEIVPSKDVMQSYSEIKNSIPSEQSINPYENEMKKSAKWSFCKKMDGYNTNLQPVENYARGDGSQPLNGMVMRDNYLGMNGKKNDLNDPYREELREVYDRPDGRNPQFNDEYYEYLETDPMTEEENINEDEYAQGLNDRSFINKREEGFQDRYAMKEREMPIETHSALKSKYKPRALMAETGYFNNEGMVQAPMGSAYQFNPSKIKTKLDTDLVWKLNSDLQSKKLQDALRNSQRTLQQVQTFDTKDLQPSLNPELKRENMNQNSKWENRNLKFDDKRLKREDEDEQKNMKTGTDEGGGGEYEDEEGKGHKDEEEYYEDADLSDEETGNENRPIDDLNQKYIKREVNKGGYKFSRVVLDKLFKNFK